MRHAVGKFEPACALCRIVARQRERPKQEGAQAADRNADAVSRPSYLLEFARVRLRREIGFEIVVQLDAVESGVFRELKALHERHLLGIRERPQIDRLLHVVPLPRGGSGRVARFLRAHGMSRQKGGACKQRGTDSASTRNWSERARNCFVIGAHDILTPRGCAPRTPRHARSRGPPSPAPLTWLTSLRSLASFFRTIRF